MNNQEQKQIVNKIKDDYTPKQRTRLDDLKALDRKVKTPAMVFTYIFGVLGALVLGVGMCLAMKILGDMMALGIVIGIVGIIIVCINYPIYKQILKKRKNKYAAQVLHLSEEIAAQEN